jgi:hypothetical protein
VVSVVQGDKAFGVLGGRENQVSVFDPYGVVPWGMQDEERTA